jgi:hypothetical protein
MKFTSFVLIILTSFLSIHVENLSVGTPSYDIYKIDSINNYYLIYAKNKTTHYKIISRKETVANTTKIKVGKRYEFKLHSMWEQDSFINGVSISLRNTPHVTCLGFDSITNICIERPLINDLHYTDDLKGLYLVQTKN